MATSILLNHVYYSPVGHVVEALQYAKGFQAANPGSEVHVALSDGAPWELASGCPWVTATYPVPLRDRRHIVPEMPREWDYIVDNNLMRLEAGQAAELMRPGFAPPAPGWEEEATLAYFGRTDAELVARRGRGVLFPKMRLPEGLCYEHTPIRLAVPDALRGFAERYGHDGPKISVLPAGSGPPATYPGTSSWAAILSALRERFPDARLYLTGARHPGRHQDLTTTRQGRGGDLLGEMLAAEPGLTDCCDIGLWEQVALLEACDLLISPHSGFSFLASCVGTPWLTISGGNWPEGFYNGALFYSVLPDDPDYPYLGAIDYDYDGPTIRGTREEDLVARLPEILDAAAFLLDPATTYEDCVGRFHANLSRARVRREHVPLPP